MDWLGVKMPKCHRFGSHLDESSLHSDTSRSSCTVHRSVFGISNAVIADNIVD